MAVEDIPPRRQRGLGDRLSNILSRMAETVGAPEEGRLGYEDYLFGGAGTATTEQVESALENVAPKEEAATLPMPEYIDYIGQSTRGWKRPLKRPDSHAKYGYYGDGNTRSTRVHAMQWIPTSVGGNVSDESKFSLLGYGGSSVTGDILVAFARPSNVQPHSLYVYEHNTEGAWNAFKNSSSLGSFIKYLNGGRLYTPSDGERYIQLHKNTMDGGYPYDYWIFKEMDRWSTIRPNNEVAGSGGYLISED